MDVGGGSTQFMFGRGGQKHFRHSFPLGSVRLLETIPCSDPPKPAELAACRQWLKEFLQKEVRPKLGQERGDGEQRAEVRSPKSEVQKSEVGGRSEPPYVGGCGIGRRGATGGGGRHGDHSGLHGGQARNLRPRAHRGDPPERGARVLAFGAALESAFGGAKEDHRPAQEPRRCDPHGRGDLPGRDGGIRVPRAAHQHPRAAFRGGDGR